MPARTRIVAVLAVAATAALALTACSPGTSSSSSGSDGYVEKGKLTIATSQPAYAPWVEDNKPQSGNGFEAAVAYAVADKLGFSKSDVKWVRDDFDKSIAPGPKDFDLNLQQFSITAERKKAVDFSSPYYTTSQVVITTSKSKAADATSLADLKGDLIGAAAGTTSYTDAVADIAPSQQVQVFNSNDDAVTALKSGQVDAIVVDLPTGFYITGAELDDGKIIGQLPAVKGDTGDQFGIVLPKGSKLTKKVSDAVDALQKDGTLAQLEQKWLNSQGNAPLLK
ncbi:ABC transporter substrate-binding protein [Gryllotalpicola koreensis]|uniref:ABC transporter substrate-binding protein n=1 Tax=Gryllotalpicola koreensis TaxID=993086 RepID=A0ABP8A3N1_9MICO